MTFEAFELAIIDLASRQVRLTVANVAAFVRLSPTRVEELLDRMAHAGRLDVEVDEERGLIFYVVRGLTPPPPHLALQPINYHAHAQPAVTHAPKSAVAGAVLGLLLPGVGLAYAAPMSAAAVVTFAIFIATQMVGALPLIGWLLSSVALGVGALASAVMGTMYVRKYNQLGRRTHLDLNATRSAGQTLLTPLRDAQRAAIS